MFTRGDVYAAQRKHAEAIKDYEATLALDKSFLLAVDRRGGERFKLGMIDESIADFNAYLKAVPEGRARPTGGGASRSTTPASTPRGPSSSSTARAMFGADVENVFWHFLCNARKDGIEKARKDLLTLKGPDKRVPMMQVYDLLHGKAKPERGDRHGREGEPEGRATRTRPCSMPTCTWACTTRPRATRTSARST